MVWSNNDLKRFWNKVINQGNNCWSWKASKEAGYGRMLFDGKLQLAHRISYQIHYGPLDDDICVLHTCDNRECTNPNHLFLGTRLDNNRDRQRKGRSSGGKNGGAPMGTRNGMAKLSESDVRMIKQLLQQRINRKLLAERFSISISTIDHIATNKKWAHVV